jgi:hypothetical protein
MSNFFYSADGRKIALERFADAASTPSFKDSLSLRGNLTLDGAIKAQRFIKEDGSELNEIMSEKRVFAVPDTLTFDAQGYMTIGGKKNDNKLLFSSQWQGFPDDKTGGAEISNDTETYKQLMIVGNKSAGGPRTVGIWDKLNVNGKLCVGSSCVDEVAFGKLIASIK